MWSDVVQVVSAVAIGGPSAVVADVVQDVSAV